MNKGYICVAQKNKDVDYLKLAYALALSIKNTQSIVNKFAVVTDEINIPEKYYKVFDYIIPLIDKSNNSDWKLHSIVDLYDYTPFDETVVLDGDMLFLTDVSHWWNILNKRNIWFTVHPRSYTNDICSKDNIYRREFIENDLPNIYNAFFYFKKCEDAEKLFFVASTIRDHWEHCVEKYLSNRKPSIFSTDVAFALAIKLLDWIQKITIFNIELPYFIHMKAQNQGWDIPEILIDYDWTLCADISYDIFQNSLGIKIGSVRQFGPFHYHIKHFLTDKMIQILEDCFYE